MQDIQYIFVFAPNNSGTTATCQYIAGQTDGYLPPFGNNEGQMVPEVRDMMRSSPWNQNSKFDWATIHAAWNNRAHLAGKHLFIEGSPPNLLRIKDIRKEFDSCAKYLFMISSPYMHVASSVYNYATPETANFNDVSKTWLDKARRIYEAIQTNPDIALVKYEDFCAQPELINKALELPYQKTYSIAGKRNSQVAFIRDLSAKTIGFLKPQEIDEIGECLMSDQALIEFFGYKILPGPQLIEQIQQDAAYYQEGVDRREKWDQQMEGGSS